MSKKGMAFHAHSYSITVETLNKSKTMSKELMITQKDVLRRPSDNKTVEFINTMEGRNYPFFSIMYHPEYQALHFSGQKKWNIVNDKDTDEIAFRISLLLNRNARKNKNRVVDSGLILGDIK